MYECIEYRVEQASAIITLNRPDRLNALTHRALAELRHALALAEQSPDVTAIIITGAGRGFCAGMDIETLASASETGDIDIPALGKRDRETPGDPTMGADFESGLSYMFTLRKPVIAAVNGPCAGMGMSLALFCDMRFASDDSCFVTSFARRGLVAEHGQSWLLPRIVGPSRALDLLWSSRRIDAREAERIGLVDRTTTRADLIPQALLYVSILQEHSAPISLMVIKRQIYRHLNVSLGEALAESEGLMQESVRRRDAREGAESYVAKRRPQFSRIEVPRSEQ
jgi:enoyl-CoA hydratase/carnithine racemase